MKIDLFECKECRMTHHVHKMDCSHRGEHTHHWVPTNTGRYTTAREPIRALACECGVAHHDYLFATGHAGLA